MSLKIISWNVNGIRAIHKKGFLDWFNKEKPDILCLQETKASSEQIPSDILDIPEYKMYFNSAEKKGYSGVGLFSKIDPIKIETGFDISRFDSEGRILIAEFQKYILYNIYFPNGKASAERLKYKMEFYNTFLHYISNNNPQNKGVIICGDVNTAHQEIDLAHPKANEKYSGFLPEERAWIDQLLDNNYIDTYRYLNNNKIEYTWWDYKTRARERNVGWRIDYFFTNDLIKSKIKSSYILSDVLGSDHCPICIILDI